MKTNRSKLTFCIVPLICLVPGCSNFPGANDSQGSSAPTNHIQLIVPALAPNPVKERMANFVQTFLERSAANSEIEIIDGTTTFQVARLRIPELRHNSGNARANALRQPLIAAAQFLRTSETPDRGGEAPINLPAILRTLPTSQPPAVILIAGSPWYQAKSDSAFSMLPDQRLPTDDHLLVSPAESPYGLAGYTNRLKGAKVIIAALGDMPSDRADEALRLFWAKGVNLAGGSLIEYTRDLGRALETALNAETLKHTEPPALVPTGELAMKSAADYIAFVHRVAILRVRDSAEEPYATEIRHHPTLQDHVGSNTGPVIRALITTNNSIAVHERIATNEVVLTNFIRSPKVEAQVITNLVTNWTFTARMQTNLVFATNKVFTTNVVLKTNYVPVMARQYSPPRP